MYGINHDNLHVQVFLFLPAGDAKNDVMTGLSKLHFHPEHYRLNAVQTFAYDPARQ